VRFAVILDPDAHGRYSVYCPAILGCVSQGESLDDALANIKEAIVLCLEVREADRFPPPHETPEVIAREIQECLEFRAEEGRPMTIETREVEIASAG
jgi:predicted RNase H-like HicB family nuclease